MTTIRSSDLLHQVKLAGKIPELVHGILHQQIIEEQAQKLRIAITDEELQEGADKFRATNKLATTTATQRWLTDRLLSLDDFEQLISLNLLTRKVADRLFSDRVGPFFYQHRLDYSGAILAEVVLEDSDLAQELFYAIQEGDMTFADVAQRYGADLETQRRAGYRGLVTRQQMLPEVSAAVFAAQPPQVMLPITTDRGVYLLWVEEIQVAELTDALAEQIRWQLFQEWLQKEIGDRLSHLRIVL